MLSSLANVVVRAGRNESGAMAVVVAVTAGMLLMGAGLAVDTARWMSARRSTAAAVDAAVLAGARTLQLDPENSSAAEAAAAKIYLANKSDSWPVASDTINFKVGNDGQSIVAKGSAKMSTTFLQVVGIEDLDVAGYSGADLAKASVAVGGGNGSNIEISLMLDVTGSMCDDGVGPCTSSNKLSGLKTAAKGLIDIVVANSQTPYTSRVALVPFSTRVRVAPDNTGGALMATLTGLPATWTGWQKMCAAGSGSGTGGSETSGNWVCTQEVAEHMTNWPIMPCVTDRFYDGPWQADATDAAPAAGAWLNAHDGTRLPFGPDSTTTAATSQTGQTPGDASYQWNYSPWGCYDVSDANVVVPLSSDKSMLKNQIDGLEAFGATAGALGTAWAWYALSPNWSTVFTGASTPRPYGDVTTMQANGSPLVRKVAVLMTDGAYNTYRGWKDNDQQLVSNYALEVCTNMKAAGVEVYTVGFSLQQLAPAERAIAEATLKACGTDLSHFYETLNVQQLQSAFRDIAMKLSAVRLTE